jgi:hypothetical protein
MTYAVGEAAILTIIRAHADYNANNSSRQDWKLLDSGKASHYAILRPGPWLNERFTLANYRRQWTTVVEVWQRYIDDTKPGALVDHVDDLVRHVESYGALDGAAGVLDANVAGGGEMEEIQRTNGALWARWSFNVVWQEDYEVVYA